MALGWQLGFFLELGDPHLRAMPCVEHPDLLVESVPFLRMASSSSWDGSYFDLHKIKN